MTPWHLNSLGTIEISIYFTSQQHWLLATLSSRPFLLFKPTFLSSLSTSVLTSLCPCGHPFLWASFARQLSAQFSPSASSLFLLPPGECSSPLPMKGRGACDFLSLHHQCHFLPCSCPHPSPDTHLPTCVLILMFWLLWGSSSSPPPFRVLGYSRVQC